MGNSKESKEQCVYSTNTRDVYVDDMKIAEVRSGEKEESNKHGTILIVEDNKELHQYLSNGF